MRHHERPLSPGKSGGQTADLGLELIREQIFFRRELRERVFWFVKLRWAVVAAALAALWGSSLAGLTFELRPLFLVTLCVAFYNLIFLVLGSRISPEGGRIRPFVLFAHLQICLDLAALFTVLHFTGGPASPLSLFVIFHVFMAGILLSRSSCVAYGIGVILALVLMAIGEWTGSIPLRGQPLLEQLNLTGQLGSLVVSIAVGAFLITTVVESLRMKGRQLLKVSAELEATTSRLQALYEMVKEMESQGDLQALMDSATRLGATIMGVKACSIKLLDEEGRYLRFASTYGLSQDYLYKGSIEVEKSPINQKIIQGALYSIGTIDEKDYFQYPEDIRREGIASMLCLPLKVGRRVLGVFCVYSSEAYRFSDKDASFFSLMTDLTALAIERLRTELAKAWFFQKAAHQLRSPLQAIISMLRVLKDGYLGEVNQRQREVLLRCERRIRLMGDLLEDLLKVGRSKAEVAPTSMKAVSLLEALRQVLLLFEGQARAKGIQLVTHLQEPLPDILGDEVLLDELLTNLISNAIKYTPQGGTVTVSLAKEGRGWVKFEVSDTGIGIPKEELPHLFTEFFRASNARALEEEGTGLGLVIVKHALERMRGSIQVKSKEGQGTTFTCLLPTLLHPGEEGTRDSAAKGVGAQEGS